ncbi:Protein of unknown function (DUF3037) [Lacibacter cauensis]|uniref:DUF3037 family protein n=1 Tax=Lacibacter cauensis TaxID=510947 RepID=A0A562SUM4_9BACT|nr:DUF3037 domain-containing protein [Lacibacter cauensis]TWI85027.1 Protein of unknown function (DUF3037) [Lacibacter cauensis]
MQEKRTFEYAVIRVVPRVEREEFLNVGVIVFCKRPAFLDMQYVLDEKRLLAIDPEIDLADVRMHLEAFEQISKGVKGSSPIAELDHAARFRWLTAKRSTIVQASAVHPGLCFDPAVTTDQLLQKLVLL